MEGHDLGLPSGKIEARLLEKRCRMSNAFQQIRDPAVVERASPVNFEGHRVAQILTRRCPRRERGRWWR